MLINGVSLWLQVFIIVMSRQCDERSDASIKDRRTFICLALCAHYATEIDMGLSELRGCFLLTVSESPLNL